MCYQEGLDGAVEGLKRENRDLREQLAMALIQVEELTDTVAKQQRQRNVTSKDRAGGGNREASARRSTTPPRGPPPPPRPNHIALIIKVPRGSLWAIPRAVQLPPWAPTTLRRGGGRRAPRWGCCLTYGHLRGQVAPHSLARPSDSIRWEDRDIHMGPAFRVITKPNESLAMWL